MNPNAVKHAAKALASAERALAKLKGDISAADAEETWQHLLGMTSRVYEKLKAGAAGNPKSWAWFGKKQDERRDDELLRYVHHAKNADHHRFEDIATAEDNRLIMRTTGPIRVDRLVINEGVIEEFKWTPLADGAEPILKFFDPQLHPEAVIDKGVTYDVPTNHRGHELQDVTVIQLAELTVDYLRELLSEADSLIS